MNCSTCKFSELIRHPENPEASVQVCRRMPPQVIVMPVRTALQQIVPQPMPMQPIVHDSDWCGEYHQRGSGDEGEPKKLQLVS